MRTRVFWGLVMFILAFGTSCGPKKQKPMEPPEEVNAPSEPARPSVPEQPPPKQPREALPLKPRAPSPGDAAALKLVQSGVAQMNSGNLDDAEVLFEQALRVSTTNGRPYYYLGVISFRRKSYDRSLAFLTQAEIYLHDDSFWMSQILLQEGLAMKSMNNKNAARAKFQEALQKDPTNKWAESELNALDSKQ